MTLTQDELKRLLHYDPSTGIFSRIVRTSNRIKIGQTSSHPKKGQGEGGGMTLTGKNEHEPIL